MSQAITMHRTTAYALAGLLMAMIIGGYVVFGSNADKGGAELPDADGIDVKAGSGAQDVYLKALTGYYDKSEIVVRKGVPVRLHFTADPNAGCGRQLVVYGLNVRALSMKGEEDVVQFTPSREGSYEYNCGMRMFRPGKLVVTA